MDNDGDIEEEQLQKDILQINQVLGSGDEDDEGDDSDIDFVIDERDTADFATRQSNELALHELDAEREPCGEDSGLTETTEECSVQQLLVVNQESQKNLHDLLIKVQEELARNQAEQANVSANPNDNEQKNVDLCVRRLFRSYFEDEAGRTPPENDETKQKKEANMPNPFEGLRIKWKKDQNEKLLEGIKTDGLKKKMQPVLNRQEVLEMKLERLSIPAELEKAYEEMKENRKKLVKMENLPDSELVGDRFRDVDWDFIASVEFDGERTGEECQLHWQNHLHPSINHRPWEDDEMKELLRIAAGHKLREWEKIAEELGTGRTALQCLSMYQQLDKTFVSPTFSKEDDELLLELVKRFQMGNKYTPFAKVAYFMEGKTPHQVTCRWTKTVDPNIKFGKWSDEEVKKLYKLVQRHGARNWSRLAEEFPGRTQYQLRQRWATLDDPGLKHGHWDYQETVRLLTKAQEIGVGKWAGIAEAMKVPGQQSRSSASVLMRFKAVVESYLYWRATTSSEESREIQTEDLYSGKLIPDLIAFVERREKELSELSPSTKQRRLKVKERRLRRARKLLEEDFEDDENEDEEPNKPVYMTARQKALALKKGQLVPETTAERSVEDEERNDKNDDAEMIPERSVEADERNDKNSDAEMIAERNLEAEEWKNKNGDAGEKPLSVRTESLEEDLSGEDDESDEDGPLQENNEIGDEIANSSSIDFPSNPESKASVFGPKGLARWFKKIQDANAARAAEIAAKAKDNKQQRDGLAEQRASYYDKQKSTFDVQSSMTYVNLKRCAGKSKLTKIDSQLVQAMDPMWLCRNGNVGRPTRQSVRVQERTKQEKLSRADQRAMFGLLLKVFDVDVKYATSLAKRRIAKSKAVGKKDKQDSKSQEDGSVIENRPSTSTVCRDTTAGVMICTPGATLGPLGESGSSQGVTVGPQGVTAGPQGVAAGLQGVPAGPQGVAAGLQGVTAGLQGVPAGPQGVSAGLQGVSAGPQRVSAGLQGVTVGLQGVTAGPQGVSAGLQGVPAGPQGVSAGLQGVSAGPQRVTVGPQGVPAGPQVVSAGLQGVTAGLQGVSAGLQGVSPGPQGVTAGPQGVPASPQGVTVGPQGVSAGLQGVTVGPQGVTVGPQGVTVGPQGVTVGPQGVTVGPQGVTVGPQGVTVGPQGVTVGLQGVTVGLQGVTAGLQGVSAGLQGVSTGPQGVTTGPQGVPAGPQGVTVGPQGVTVGPQGVTVGPQGVTVGPQGVTVGPQGVPVGPQGVPAGPQGVTVGHQGVTVGPQRVTVGPQGVSACPQGVSACPQGVTVGPQGVTSGLQGLILGPQGLTASPLGLNVGPLGVPIGPQGVTLCPQGVAAGPQGVTASPVQFNAGPLGIPIGHQGVAAYQQGVASGPQGFIIGPQRAIAPPIGPQSLTVNAHSQGGTTGPQAVLINPQTVIASPQGRTTGPQGVIRGPKPLTNSLQKSTGNQQGATTSQHGENSPKQSTGDAAALPQDTLVEQVPHEGQPDTAPPSIPPVKMKEPAVGSGSLEQTKATPDKQPAELKGSDATKFALSKYLPIRQKGRDTNAPVALIGSNQFALKSVPPQPQPLSVSPSMFMLRNNQTGQLLLVQGPTQTTVTHPNTAAAAPQTQVQSTLMPGSLPAVQFGAPNQLNLLRPGVPLQVRPQNFPMNPVQALQSPVRSLLGLTQQGSSPSVVSNPHVFMRGVQGSATPFFTLPVPHAGFGNVQLPVQQVQPAQNVVENTQPPQNQASLKPQVPHSANAPGTGSVTEAVVPQATPAVTTSTDRTESSPFVELPLRDGSKIALTLDQYKAFKAGKLGDVTCPRLIPSQSEKTVPQPLNSGRGSKRIQTGETQEREDPDSLNLEPLQSVRSPGRFSKSTKPQPFKPKLHTQDIPLLPPNIATLQALTSLLMDRKNLEQQRDLFLAKFERQVEKQQEEKRGNASFKGYLESRRSAEVASSQSNNSSGTPQKPDQNGCMQASHPQAMAPQQSVSSQILEEQMDVLRKSDLHKVLVKRFLSLFLWPGLLSSTRIKGSVSTTTAPSHIAEDPFVVPKKRKWGTASAQTNSEKKSDKKAPSSEKASVRRQPTVSTILKAENQTEVNSVINLDAAAESEVSGNQEATIETASASGCHNNEKKEDAQVGSCGLKRKAEDSVLSCNGEEEQVNGETDDDAADVLRCKKRRAAVCGSGDATF